MVAAVLFVLAFMVASTQGVGVGGGGGGDDAAPPPQGPVPQDRAVRILPADALGLRSVPPGWNDRTFFAFDAVGGQALALPTPLAADAGCYLDIYSTSSTGARVAPAALPVTAGGALVDTVPPNDALRCTWNGVWGCARPPAQLVTLPPPAQDHIFVDPATGNTSVVYDLPADVAGRVFVVAGNAAETGVFARAPRPDEASLGSSFVLVVNVGGGVQRSARTTAVAAEGGGYTWVTLPLAG